MEILAKSDEVVLVSMRAAEFREAFGQSALIAFDAKMAAATTVGAMVVPRVVRPLATSEKDGEKVCRRCGRPFKDRSHYRNRKYCTRRCYLNADRTRREKQARSGSVVEEAVCNGGE